MRIVLQALSCVAGALCLNASFESFMMGRHFVSSFFLFVALLNAHSFVSSRSRT